MPCYVSRSPQLLLFIPQSTEKFFLEKWREKRTKAGRRRKASKFIYMHNATVEVRQIASCINKNKTSQNIFVEDEAELSNKQVWGSILKRCVSIIRTTFLYLAEFSSTFYLSDSVACSTRCQVKTAVWGYSQTIYSIRTRLWYAAWLANMLMRLEIFSYSFIMTMTRKKTLRSS